MKKLLPFIVTAFIFITTSALANFKVGIVDLNKILSSDPQVKVLQVKLKKQFEPRSQEVMEAQKALEADIEKFNKEREKLKGEDLKKAQQKLIDKEQKLQNMREKAQRDLMQEQNKAMQEIFGKIKKIVSDIANKLKLDLVITNASVIYNKPELDITDQILNKIKK